MEVHQKMKNEAVISSGNPTSGYVSRGHIRAFSSSRPDLHREPGFRNLGVRAHLQKTVQRVSGTCFLGPLLIMKETLKPAGKMEITTFVTRL